MSISLESDRQHQYLQQAEAEFLRISEKIDIYQNRVQQYDPVFALAYQIELANLEVKRNAVQRKLQRLQQADESHWKQLQQDFEQAWNELNDAFFRAMASLERG